MSRSVDRSVLGAWLLKANPVVWDLRAFLATGERRLTSWSVRPGYRADLMAAGDRALFWLSGDGRDGLVRGIWADGRVTGPAEPWVEEEVGHWRRPEDAARVRCRVPVDLELFDAPVAHAELRAVGVNDLEVQRQPFGPNPSWVSRDQLTRIELLLG
ncbi:EVE domain-containing protein [Desertihabitans aurantiacus]|uniref:EVE domain-containing protein n=1 Tax=Desertihabitans aurantiacus TaxID=2282477 RepID=UPI000DF7FB6A|nr:EVE domain-containing protein [Desertihabitans aurantiacus]